MIEAPASDSKPSLPDLGTAPEPPEAQRTKLEEQIDLWSQVIEDTGVAAP